MLCQLPLPVFFYHFPDLFHPFNHEHPGFSKVVFRSISVLIQKCVVLCVKGVYGVQQTGKMIVYASTPDSLERRSAQSAMYEILVDLAVMLTPIISFTTEEMWQYLPKKATMPATSIQMMPWPVAKAERHDVALEEKWANFIEIRNEITKVLEAARRAKTIGHSLDAKVVLYATGESYKLLTTVQNQLANLLIVSQAKVCEGTDSTATATALADLQISVLAATGEKCERCWIYSEEIGQNLAHPTLCPRCASVVK